MTRAPFVFGKTEGAFSRTPPQVYDTTIGWRFTNPRMEALGHTLTMGETAEVVAERYDITREAQDRFALESQRRGGGGNRGRALQRRACAGATCSGPKGEQTLLTTDEHPRADTTLEALARLKPAFKQGGTVTAGNSSGVNDGAAALLIASSEALRTHNLQPLARIVSTAVAGVEPAAMGLGPIAATRKALARAGLTIADIDLVELNEAFASQSLACIAELGLDPARVNVHGGAIALGHPLGASGAKILTTLAHELRRRGGRYGLATMCIGVGQGIATIVEHMG